MDTIEFRVLGPLAVVREGTYLDTGTAKQQTLLALLVAHRNHVVTIDRVAAELWPVRPPGSVVANVRTYVSSLRRVLGPHRSRLVTRRGSYAIEISDAELDEARFRNEAAKAAVALRDGDAAAALEHFQAALAECRGEVLQDLAVGPYLRRYVKQLTAERLDIEEKYLETCRRCGRDEEAIAGLRRIVAVHPARETAWEALVAALYETGDRSAALDTYQDARRAMAEELGLDPGPRLAELHISILRGAHSAPQRDDPPAPETAPPAPVPRQLPPAPLSLVGRDTELAAVVTGLTSGHPHRIVAVHGGGGAGKTALALAAAYAVRDAFPDGELFVDLRGPGQGLDPVDPDQVLTRFLRALGAPQAGAAVDPHEAAATFRSLLADRRMLVVLDNAHDVAQVRPLLPAAPGCAVLITSRHPMETLDGAVRVGLSGLAHSAAEQLMRTLVGADRVEREAVAYQQIAQLCGMLPLALKVLAMRIARHPDMTGSEVLAALVHERTRLDQLGFADLDVRSTLESGYRSMRRHSPVGRTAALLFRRMGAGRFREVSARIAADLVDGTMAEGRRALDALIDHGLVDCVGDRYRMHDLISLLAAELAAETDTVTENRAAIRRVADGYLRRIRGNGFLYVPGDTDLPVADDTADGETGPTSAAEAATWLDENVSILHALLTRLVEDPDGIPVAYDIVSSLSIRMSIARPADCLWLCGPLLTVLTDVDIGRAVRLLPVVLHLNLTGGQREELAARRADARALLARIDDDRQHAHLTANIALASVRLGEPAAALADFTAAMAGFARADRPVAVAICLLNAVEATYALDLLPESVAMLRRSVAIVRRHSHGRAEPSLFDSLGMVQLRAGRYRLADLHLSRALRTAEPGEELIATVLQRRAFARYHLGRHAEAVADARQAAEYAHTTRNPQLHLEATRTLAAIMWVTGDPHAGEALRRADALAAETRSP